MESVNKRTINRVSEVGGSEGGSKMGEDGKRCSGRDRTRGIRVAFGEDYSESNGPVGRGH